MGNKYIFKPDKNPPPGAYNLESGLNMSQTKTRSAHIRGETSPYRRPKQQNPDPGLYDGHLTAFGADIKTNIGMGSKYEFKPDKNPPVGAYDPNSGYAMSSTSKRARSAHIRGEVHSFRRPKEQNPDPGHYDGHLTSFGAEINTKVTMGSKYEFKPDKNPPVGAYDPTSGIAMSSTSKKSRSAIIREEVYAYRRPK